MHSLPRLSEVPELLLSASKRPLVSLHQADGVTHAGRLKNERIESSFHLAFTTTVSTITGYPRRDRVLLASEATLGGFAAKKKRPTKHPLKACLCPPPSSRGGGRVFRKVQKTTRTAQAKVIREACGNAAFEAMQQKVRRRWAAPG